MTRKLFGTDGVRGIAGEFLSAELALALAQAATRQTATARPQVLVIRDTRESGEMLQAAVAAGVSAAGGDALLGGVLPTPAAPLLIARYDFDLAVVLSASHNPYRDNGDEVLRRARATSSPTRPSSRSRPSSDVPARPTPATRARRGRSGACASCGAHRRITCASCMCAFAELDLAGLDVLLDCANGATFHVAPEIFRRLGAKVSVIADEPDGRNINAGCGSTARGAARRARARGRATRSASPSTVTATACWRSIAAGRWWTAMS